MENFLDTFDDGGGGNGKLTGRDAKSLKIGKNTLRLCHSLNAGLREGNEAEDMPCILPDFPNGIVSISLHSVPSVHIHVSLP